MSLAIPHDEYRQYPSNDIATALTADVLEISNNTRKSASFYEYMFVVNILYTGQPSFYSHKLQVGGCNWKLSVVRPNEFLVMTNLNINFIYLITIILRGTWSQFYFLSRELC